MEATCEENINSLKLILSNVDKPDALSFDIDVGSIQGQFPLLELSPSLSVELICRNVFRFRCIG